MSNSITMYGFYRAPTPHIIQRQHIGPTINRSTNMTRSNAAAAMPRKKGAVDKNTAQEDGQSPVKWEKSDGKKFLKKELWNLDSAFQSMSIKNIHSSDPRFSVYPLKNYTTNFRNLKKKVDGLRVQVDFDEQAFSQHKKSYPRSSHMKRGYPHWNGHPAKEHLEDDVYNRIADTMPPSELRMTRTSYQDFPPDIFCQETSRRDTANKRSLELCASIMLVFLGGCCV